MMRPRRYFSPVFCRFRFMRFARNTNLSGLLDKRKQCHSAVLSCLISSCLSCVVLPCLVLCRLALSCLVLSRLALSRLVLSCLVLSRLALSRSILSHVPFVTIRRSSTRWSVVLLLCCMFGGGCWYLLFDIKHKSLFAMRLVDTM